MTLISLADACRLLASDPKTVHRWLAAAHVPLQPHPSDARSKVLPVEQLRQVALAHRRMLPELSEALPASVAALQPPEPPPLSPDLLDGLKTLAALSAQVVVLQQRLAELTAVLSCVAVAASSSPEEPTAVPGASTSAPSRRRAASSSPKQRRETATVLPLVEYGTTGGYVVISPKRGLLTLEPDTPQWFAWLATQSSFRFVGREGRLTAHRESQRLPRAVWRAHRQIRNHTYNHRLGPTEFLTISALEQAAAALQAHLT